MGETKISKAYKILEDYQGDNPYIALLSKQYKRGGKVLSDFEVQYVNKNKDYIPIDVNKVIGITKDLGQKLFEKNNLAFVPEKIKVTKIIGEMGDSYHAYFKYRQSEGEKLAYIQKKGLLGKLFTVDWKSFEVDFEKYDEILQPIKLREHQKDGVRFMVANKKCVCADEMGTGKMQDVDTMIPTPDGIKRFGDLVIGDLVFGSDGRSHTVTATFKHENKDIYEIEFIDGTKTNSGLEHLWIVQDMNNIRRSQGWKVMSLNDILKRGLQWKNKNNSYKFRIPICKPVEYSEKEYFIHPYILGLAIGDGNLCNKRVSISIPKHETETVDRIKGLLNEKYKLTRRFYGVCPNYLIVKKEGPKNKPNLYIREIERLGLNVHGNYKFIPEEYKMGSIHQRMELLMGLMDSDGSITEKRNKIRYSTNSKQLAEDISDLVRSLGGMARIHQYMRKKSTKVEYNINIQIKFCPFKIERKKKRYTIDETHKKYLVKSIKSVKLLKTCDAMCITVDSPDGSYLTNDYIVTHNTITSLVSALEAKAEHILIISPASLKTNWKKEAMRFMDDNDIQIISGSKWREDVPKVTIINYEIVQNFYEVPEEPVFEDVEIRDYEGNVVEVLKRPVMVKKSGKLVQKTKKSMKKLDISASLKKSPLFLGNFDCVIIDEAQKLANKGSIRYKTISDFLKKSNPNYVFLLTGTPLTNNPMNLYNILNLIGADVTKDYRYYIKRFMGAKEHNRRDGGKYVTFGEPQNLEELRDKIKECYIRRLTTDVGVMVGKTVSRRYFDFSEEQRAKYSLLWDDYVNAQEGNDVSLGETYSEYWNEYENESDLDKNRQLIEGGLIRQFFGREMVAHTIDVVNELLEDGEKVVVMTVFRKEMDMLKEYYGDKAVCYRGGMTAKQKDSAQDAFNNDNNVKVFLGNIIASGTGISLPVSRKIVFNNFEWNYSDNVQAESRIHRLTQTRDVECIYMLFNDSISEEMFDKVLYKGYLMDETIKSENEKK